MTMTLMGGSWPHARRRAVTRDRSGMRPADFDGYFVQESGVSATIPAHTASAKSFDHFVQTHTGSKAIARRWLAGFSAPYSRRPASFQLHALARLVYACFRQIARALPWPFLKGGVVERFNPCPSLRVHGPPFASSRGRARPWPGSSPCVRSAARR